MMTAKASLVLILAYVLALAAGTTSGLLADRLRSPAGPTAPLAAQLQLTPAQCDRIRAVWEGVSQTVDQCYQQAQNIQQQRDDALYRVLTDAQKERFATMDKEFARWFADLKAQRQAAFNAALAKTESMLTAEQRATYERIIHQRLGNSMAGATTQPSLEDLRP